jgi:hypothetical protein
MDDLKWQLFAENYPGAAFPSFRSLSAAEMEPLRRRMAERVRLPADVDSLDLVRRVYDVETWFRDLDAQAESLRLDEAFRRANITPPAQVLVNWYRFENVDELAVADLIRYFHDIWFPGVDDIAIFDESCDWVLSVMHYGSVRAVHFPLPPGMALGSPRGPDVNR